MTHSKEETDRLARFLHREAKMWHKARVGMSYRFALTVALLALAAPASPQRGDPTGSIPQPPAGLPRLPPLGGINSGLERTRQDALRDATDALEDTRATVRVLAGERLERLRDLVRVNREQLEMTELGPAVRGQVVAVDPDPATLAAAQAEGFRIEGDERIEGLDLRSVTLAVPRGWPVDRALRRLRRIAPDAEFAANHLHVQSGPETIAAAGASLAQAGARAPLAIGLIDGGVAAHPALRGSIDQRGFVAGAPRPSGHGTAIASLIAGSGAVRGAATGVPLLVADIYGSDPAGGNALALARALGWLSQQRAPVVAVSLVGPPNPLVARAVSQARSRGMLIVAAVGNDGAAAPPAYPASYPGVIAVTGVDSRNRPLIEAGRALHLDYAAPGADMAAAGTDGRVASVRGTSYAVPFVAGRLINHAASPEPLAGLDREADPRGGRGRGRGVICGTCRTPVPRN